MRMANADQAAAWNGAEGEHWARHGARGRAGNEELHDHLFGAAAIGPDDVVLDIGCGTGGTTLLAARRAARGLVVGIDLSAPMLHEALAAAEREGLDNVRFQRGDAQVHPFPDGGFDVAISQFGVMFFADPVEAFANIARALGRGGRLAFVCPRDLSLNEWYTLPTAALLRLVPGAADDPPESGMFSLSRRERLVEVLTRAGLDEISIRPFDAPMPFGADLREAVDFYLGSGPVRAFLEDNPQVPAPRAREVLTTVLRPFEGAGGVRVPGANWLVSARRPRS
jgi:SAM-dependent methyltransferase